MVDSRPQIKDLFQGAHIHFMGICGTAMGSLAGLLKDRGFKITGSDQNIYPPMSTQLESLGIPIYKGYKKENLEPKPDFVVVGNVISSHFEEAQALLNSGIPFTSLPAALGEWVIEDRSCLVVAGTHGKTTTTSMASWVAEVCGYRPGFLIGGIPLNFPRSFRNPVDDNSPEQLFVIEGDEYDTAFFDKVPKFVHYKPKYVILTSIEFDHADIYNNLDEVLVSFRKLLELIPEDGCLVYNKEDENIQKILSSCRAKKISYGMSDGQYRVSDRANLVGRNQFSVHYYEESAGATGHEDFRSVADLALKSFGPHNTMNALAVYAMSRELGWTNSKVLQAFADFKGVKRRQEIIGEKNNVTVVEDFAHHPTAVSLTLDCMREQFPQRRVISIFEPRSATSRRRVFELEFAQALAKSDVVLLPRAFDQEKIKEEERFSSERVVEILKSQNHQAHYCSDHSEILSNLKEIMAPGDVVLIMSNGGFGGIYEEILKLL